MNNYISDKTHHIYIAENDFVVKAVALYLTLLVGTSSMIYVYLGMLEDVLVLVTVEQALELVIGVMMTTSKGYNNNFLAWNRKSLVSPPLFRPIAFMSPFKVFLDFGNIFSLCM